MRRTKQDATHESWLLGLAQTQRITWKSNEVASKCEPLWTTETSQAWCMTLFWLSPRLDAWSQHLELVWSRSSRHSNCSQEMPSDPCQIPAAKLRLRNSDATMPKISRQFVETVYIHIMNHLLDGTLNPMVIVYCTLFSYYLRSS